MLTVEGDRPISFAISLICLPVASSHMTRYSRSESFSCSAFCGSDEHSLARISASDAETYLPPFATLRTAVVNSVGALSFVM